MKLKELKQKLNIEDTSLDVLDRIALGVFEARTKKGMSQSELAKKMGTKQSVISRLESRGSNPTMSLLIKISKALDIPIYSPFDNNPVRIDTKRKHLKSSKIKTRA